MTGKVLPSKPMRGAIDRVVDSVSGAPKTTHIITTLDGEIHYRAEASSIDEALEHMSRYFGYGSYTSMCVDLGYTGQEFIVSRVITQRQAEDENQEEYRKQSIKDMARAALHAFKISKRVDKITCNKPH